MGGICGFIGRKDMKRDLLLEMGNRLAHRGPDGHGEAVYQLEHSYTVGLASRWLDRNSKADQYFQPMQSENERVSVILDGEIYNFKDIRDEINDYAFKTNCDTEVIVAAYLKWGIRFVEKLNGNYAVALLDRDENTLYLMRDIMGAKPLHYYVSKDKDIVFSSEINALLVCPDFVREVNTEIIGSYLHHAFINGTDTMYRNVHKVEKGHIVKIKNGEIEEIQYWSIAQKYNACSKNKVGDYEQAKYELKKRIEDAVALRISDGMPIGCFFSGGYDSSLIAAIAQEKSPKPVCTYSVGFYEEGFNEAPYAKRVANHLGTKHTEMYFEEPEMLRVIEDFPAYFAEPVADEAVIPTLLMSSRVRKDLPAVLTGTGGDELFIGGLSIYSILQEAQKKQKAGKLLHLLREIPGIKNGDCWGKLPLIYKIVSEDTNYEIKTQTGVEGYTRNIDKILINRPSNYYFDWESEYDETNYGVIRSLLDLDTYTPNCELHKEDRGTMQFALERRSPFLDKNVMEYAFRLPREYKMEGLIGKKILRDLCYEYIPGELLDRPKAGFCVPLDKWLRGSLKDKLMDLTNRDFLIRQGIFKPDETIMFVKQYLQTGDQGSYSGKNYSKIIWPYFIFQQWYDYYFMKQQTAG